MGGVGGVHRMREGGRREGEDTVTQEKGRREGVTERTEGGRNEEKEVRELARVVLPLELWNSSETHL